MRQRHDVVVVGAGNAGASVAGRLRRDGCRDVALVEPKDVHHYRPLLSYVAGGQATLDDLTRPQDDVVPAGVRRYADRVVGVDAQRSVVHLAGGGTLEYGDLVLCPGSQVDWDAVPGAREAVATPHASTSYLPEHAPEAWDMLSTLRHGRVVVWISDRHVPCAPVGLKPLLLAAGRWRRTGALEDVDVEVLVEGDALAGLPRADAELRDALARVGARVRTGVTVERVFPEARSLLLRSGDGEDAVDYDAFFLVPPHRAPAWVAASGLADAASDGFVAVDPQTLQHRTFPRVWALGDVATLDTSSSGGGLRRQAPVVARNIQARRTGRPFRRYDGYTVAPVTTTRSRLLLAEHDRDGIARPTLPFPDLVRPRWSLWFFDRYLEPPIYWRRLTQGKVS